MNDEPNSKQTWNRPQERTTFKVARRAAFQHANLGQASVIKQYNQTTQFPRVDPELKKGVCAAIGLQWMAMSAQSKDFWNYITTEEGIGNTIAMQRREAQGLKARALVLAEFGKAQSKYREQMRTGAAPSNEILARARKAASDTTEMLALADGQQAEFRKDYLETTGGLKRKGDPQSYASAMDATNDLMGVEGYAYISCRGEKQNHAICAYFSSDQVRIMDPNQGELSVDDALVGAISLQAHLQAQSSLLGNLKEFVVEFYPFSQAPGRLEKTVADGQASAGADDGRAEQSGNEVVGSVINSNHEP